MHDRLTWISEEIDLIQVDIKRHFNWSYLITGVNDREEERRWAIACVPHGERKYKILTVLEMYL